MLVSPWSGACIRFECSHFFALETRVRIVKDESWAVFIGLARDRLKQPLVFRHTFPFFQKIFFIFHVIIIIIIIHHHHHHYTKKTTRMFTFLLFFPPSQRKRSLCTRLKWTARRALVASLACKLIDRIRCGSQTTTTTKIVC